MPDPGPVVFAEKETTAHQAIGVITLSVEKTLNALSLPMVEMMLEQLHTWQQDDRIVAIWLNGAGDKAFCAGGDVQQLYHSAIKTPGGPCVEAETFFEQEYRLDYLLHTYPKPVVCWGAGIVMGGGLGLFAACSHAIAADNTRIAMPEVTIALYPDVGGTWFLNKMPGKCGLFLALTGASINGSDAVYAGLARYEASHTAQSAVLEGLLELEWSAQPEHNHGVLSAYLAQQLSDQPHYPSNLAAHQTLIDELCSGDSLDQVVANILALDSQDKWLARARDGLAHGSSIAVNTIWNQLHKGAGLSLEEVFPFELMLSTNVVRHPEFAEGVRALLIDKDKNPQWMYSTPADVPADLMRSFFTSPWAENPLKNLAGAA